MKYTLLLLTLLCILTGCSTTGHFKIPDGSQLYLYKRSAPEQVQANGTVTTQPFFWTAAGIPPGGGVPYKLEKDGQVLKEGKLRAKFRVVSLFWPPFSLIYWPMGLNPNITYDLINDTQQ